MSSVLKQAVPAAAKAALPNLGAAAATAAGKAAAPAAAAAAPSASASASSLGSEPIGGRYRVWNFNLPPQKGVAFAFATLFGIGRTQGFRLCGDLGLNPYQKLREIPDADFEAIKHKIETTFEPKHALLKRVGDNILAKVRMGSYQGLRHQMCLPVRGQRTRSNAKTQRKLGAERAKLFNIPVLSKKAKQSATAGGAPAGGNAKPAAAK